MQGQSADYMLHFSDDPSGTLPTGNLGLSQLVGGVPSQIHFVQVASASIDSNGDAHMSLSAAVSGALAYEGDSTHPNWYRVIWGVPLIVIAPPAASVTTASLADAMVANAYSATLAASGGTAPYTWKVSGRMPAGLSFAPSSGVLSGTPTAPGLARLTFAVTDAKHGVATKTLTLMVAPAHIDVAPSSLVAPTYLVPYKVHLSATGGTGAYKYMLTGGAFRRGRNWPQVVC